MVITVHCPSCSTAFPVDTNKVPEGGVYARCSECAGVFFVERPEEERVAAPRAEVGGGQAFQSAAPPPAGIETRDDDHSSGWRESPAAQEQELESDPWQVGAAAGGLDADPWSQPSYGAYERGGDAGSETGQQDALTDSARDAEEGLAAWAPHDTLFVPDAPVAWDTPVVEDVESTHEGVAEPPPTHERVEEVEAEVEVYPPAPVSSDAWRDAIEEPAGDAFEITEVYQETVTAPPRFEEPAAPLAPSNEVSAPEEAAPEPAAAPPSWAPPPEPPRAPVTSSPGSAATSFSFGRRDPHEKARRLARVLVSDMIMYNPERHSRAIQSGSLREDFNDEIKKSWQEYVDQVGDEIANSTNYFDDALNDILARGQRVFP